MTAIEINPGDIVKFKGGHERFRVLAVDHDAVYAPAIYPRIVMVADVLTLKSLDYDTPPTTGTVADGVWVYERITREG